MTRTRTPNPSPILPQGTPPRAVHFCQGGIRGGGASVSASMALLPIVLFFGGWLAFMGYLALARFPGLPLGVRAAIMSALFLAVLAVLFRNAARAYRRAMNALDMSLPMELDPAAPVNVICWPDQRDALRALEPAPGDPGAFEPEAHRVLIAQRVSLATRMLDAGFRARFLACGIVLPILLQAIIQFTAHGLLAWESLFLLAALAGLAPFAWSLVRPTYLRVSPGRVDIVRYRFIGAKARITTHSLRERPLRLDLRRKELLIGGWHPSHPDAENDNPIDPETSKLIGNARQLSSTQTFMGSPAQLRDQTIIPLWGTLESPALERAVFRAAVSTAEPAPLPDDALL